MSARTPSKSGTDGGRSHGVSRREALLAGAGAGVGAAALLGPTGTLAAGVSPRPDAATSKPIRSGRAAGAGPALPTVDAVYRSRSHPADLGIAEAAALLRSGRISSVELTGACFERIDARNGPISFAGSPDSINAWIRLHRSYAMKLAERADRRLSRARRNGTEISPLCGVPLGLKDLYAVRGKGLEASSRVLQGNVAAGDSTVWKRLKAAGMVLIGHTHTHEFAAGTTTPQTGNPWDLSKVIGGSSGGSAAALAARMVPAATGSDTGGSLRYPAALGGVSSIKPTFGRVSAHGVVPLSWTLDHAGPMARCAADLGLMLEAMQGPDQADGGTLAVPRRPQNYPSGPERGRRAGRMLAGRRIGIPDLPGDDDFAPGVAAVIESFHDELRRSGATLIPVEVPADNVGLDVLAADVDAYHRQFVDRQYLYGPATGALILAVRALDTSTYGYLQAQRERAHLADAWDRMLVGKRLDCVAQPVLAAEPPARTGGVVDQVNPLSLIDALDSPWISTQNNTGFPLVTTPVGHSTRTGIPVGVQLIGRPNTEKRLLKLAIAYQADHPHWEQEPPGPA